MKSAAETAVPKNIGEYLSRISQRNQAALEELRGVIRSAAPNAEEAISYRVPTFKLNGPLVAFAAFDGHCSFFVMSPKLMPAFAKELEALDWKGATIHFTAEKPLPPGLVKKIVLARVKENKIAAESRIKTKTRNKTL